MDALDDPTGRMPEKLTLAEAARFFASDLPGRSERQLAQMLAEIGASPPGDIRQTLEPLARAALARRRIVTGIRSAASRDW